MTVNVSENFCRILSENYPHSLNWLERQNLLSELAHRFSVQYPGESFEEMTFLVPLFVRLEIESEELRGLLLVEHAVKSIKTEPSGFQVVEAKLDMPDFGIQAGKILITEKHICNLKTAEILILETLEEGISLPWKDLRKVLHEAAADLDIMELDQAYFGLRKMGIKV